MAIDRLAYKLVMDHKQFVDGAVASRKELNLAKQVMFETQTPAQKYQKQLDSLGGLLKKGAIDQRTYNAAVKQLKKPTDAASSSIAKQAMGFIKLNPGLTAAAAGTAAFYAAQRIARKVISEVTDAVKGQFDEVDRLAKLSVSLGISTESLATFGLIAGRSGTDIEQFNKSLKTMQKNIGEVAALGTGEAAKWLDKLKVDINDIKSLKPEDAFLTLTDAISKLPTQMEKASAAQAIFGRGAQDVLRLLSMSKEEFNAVREEAESFGLTISNIDAAGVEEANDAIGDLKAIITGLARTAAVELAPSVAVAAEMIEEFVQSGEGVDKVRDAFIGTAKAIEIAADLVDGMIDRFRLLARLMEITGLPTLARAVGASDAATDIAIGAVKGVTGLGTIDGGGEATDFIEDFADRVEQKKKEIEERFANAGNDGDSLLGNPFTGGGFTAAEEAKKEVDKINDELDKLDVPATQTDPLDELFERVGTEAKAAKKEVEEFKKEVSKFSGAIEQGSQEDIAVRAAAMRFAQPVEKEKPVTEEKEPFVPPSGFTGGGFKPAPAIKEEVDPLDELFERVGTGADPAMKEVDKLKKEMTQFDIPAIKDQADPLDELFAQVGTGAKAAKKEVEELKNEISQFSKQMAKGFTGLGTIDQFGIGIAKGMLGVGSDGGKEADDPKSISTKEEIRKQLMDNLKQSPVASSRFTGGGFRPASSDILTKEEVRKQLMDNLKTSNIEPSSSDILTKVRRVSEEIDRSISREKVDSRRVGQRDNFIRAEVSRTPGAGKEAAEKSVDLLGEAIIVLKEISSKTEGVVVSELTDLPT